MKIFFSKPTLAAAFIGWLALYGCMARPTVPTNFFMLAPLAAKTSGEAGEGRILVAVKTVQIPGYLDRPQIVTRQNEMEYQLAEFNRWAEALGDTLTRVIAENLSQLLSAASVEVLPAANSIAFDYSIEVEVLRLDGRLGEQVTLSARWAIFGPDEDLILLRKSEHREAAGDDSYRGLVTAQSRTVEKLSRDITAAMQKTLADRSRQR
jgi:uncharacterized lipoprotein YmbA